MYSSVISEQLLGDRKLSCSFNDMLLLVANAAETSRVICHCHLRLECPLGGIHLAKEALLSNGVCCVRPEDSDTATPKFDVGFRSALPYEVVDIYNYDVR